MSAIIGSLKNEILEINGKILNIDDVVKDILKKISIKGKKDLKAAVKAAELATAQILILAGSNTADDVVITKALEAAIIAGVTAYGNGMAPPTTEQMDPIFAAAFKQINAWQLDKGKYLKEKAEKL